MTCNLPKYLVVLIAILAVGCGSTDDSSPESEPGTDTDTFYFGADLSYVNQILDHNGIYREGGAVKDPYKIFSDNGTNLVRLRLWHNPIWTKEVYDGDGTQLYNDLADVERAIARSKAEGMQVLLDFHYSDTWADPGKQHIPEAWTDIETIEVLKDSVYEYTLRTLTQLRKKGLLPEFIQIGNETNCGMLFTDAPAAFPKLNVCDGNWENMGAVVNAGIKAARKAAEDANAEINVILHVADPKNVEWWFDNLTSKGNVSDFDIIGFSYYPLWHTTVPLGQIEETVRSFRSRYKKDVMILETAYPWTTDAADEYNNAFSDMTPLSGFPFTHQGQYEFLVRLTQEVRRGEGIGVIYWEPAWITSEVKDLWGTGSSWENNTFFDFNGERHKGMEFMKFNY